MTDAFVKVLERAIVAIEEENRALRLKQPMRFSEMQAHKSIVLFEFERLSAGTPRPSAPMLERLRTLRDRLAENRALLLVNVAALKEVIVTLQELRLGEELDGTYSAQSVSGACRL